MSKEIRSQETKEAFIKYLDEHPQERFWQAVRNFANVGFVTVSDTPPFNYPGASDEWKEVGGLPEDTFYREEL